MKNPTDAKLSPQLMDSGLGCALKAFSNTSSVQLLRNKQLNCSWSSSGDWWLAENVL